MAEVSYQITLHKRDGGCEGMGEYSFPHCVRVDEYVCLERGENEYRIDSIVNHPSSVADLHIYELGS